MITAMERLVAAINGEPSDRIPIFCNMIDQGARELNISIKDYYSNGFKKNFPASGKIN